MAVVARAGPGAVRLGPIHFHAGPACGDFKKTFLMFLLFYNTLQFIGACPLLLCQV